MRLRIPGWLRPALSVKVNGRALEASASPGSYLTLSRAMEGRRQDRNGAADAASGWKRCPTIPTRRHSSTAPWCWRAISVAKDSRSGRSWARMRRACPARVIQSSTASQRAAAGSGDRDPVVHREGRPRVMDQAGGGALEFRTTGQQKDVTLAPINSIFGTRYSVYWQVS